MDLVPLPLEILVEYRESLAVLIYSTISSGLAETNRIFRLIRSTLCSQFRCVTFPPSYPILRCSSRVVTCCMTLEVRVRTVKIGLTIKGD
jgi:hypothetical protein